MRPGHGGWPGRTCVARALPPEASPSPEASGDIREWLTVHVVHCQPRPSVFEPCIQKPRDARVLESAEDLPLRGEAQQHGFGIRSPPHHLERHLAVEQAVGSACAVHIAHTALAHTLFDVVWTYCGAHKTVGLIMQDSRDALRQTLLTTTIFHANGTSVPAKIDPTKMSWMM